MPLVLGGAAIALIFLMILTLFTLYFILTKWRDTVQGLPLVGNALGNLADALRSANLQIIHEVADVAHAVISWSIDRIHDGFKLLFDIYSAVIHALIMDVTAKVAGIQAVLSSNIIPNIASIWVNLTGLSDFVHGFIELNVNALTFWKAQTIAFDNAFVIPNINKLLGFANTVETVLLPQLSLTITAINKALLGLINDVVKPMRQELTDLSDNTATTLRAPRVGVLPRLGTVEGEMAQVLPWAAAIGLTMPAALNLAKLADDPCWCTTSGPLQDSGVFAMAAMMDLL